MTDEKQFLGAADLARLFGAPQEEIESLCAETMAETNLSHQILSGTERDEVLLTVLKKVLSTDIPTAGEARQPDWDSGWQENLDEFLASDGDLMKLVPKYFKKRVPARLDGKWVIGDSDHFVFELTHVYRSWIFGKYLADAPAIAEFGCGPAYHLAYLAKRFPEKQLFGFDWASSSNRIVDTLAEKYGWPLTGGHFDFFNPDTSVELPENSAIYTFGALEQVHDRHTGFIDFVLAQKPSIVVNVECLHELYNTDDLSDFVALAYHRRRDYLSGYLTRLRELETQGRIEILKTQHFRFGNMNDDPLSHVIWKPL